MCKNGLVDVDEKMLIGREGFFVHRRSTVTNVRSCASHGWTSRVIQEAIRDEERQCCMLVRCHQLASLIQRTYGTRIAIRAEDIVHNRLCLRSVLDLVVRLWGQRALSLIPENDAVAIVTFAMFYGIDRVGLIGVGAVCWDDAGDDREKTETCEEEQETRHSLRTIRERSVRRCSPFDRVVCHDAPPCRHALSSAGKTKANGPLSSTIQYDAVRIERQKKRRCGNGSKRFSRSDALDRVNRSTKRRNAVNVSDKKLIVHGLLECSLHSADSREGR